MYCHKNTSLWGLLLVFIFISCHDKAQYKGPTGYDINNPVNFFMPNSLHEISGISFLNDNTDSICAIEDETGTANLVVFKDLFNTYRKEIIQSRLLMVEGKLEKEGEVIHVIVKRCYDFSRLLRQLTVSKEEAPTLKPKLRSDETTSPFLTSVKAQSEIIQGRIFPEGRNFR